MEGQDNLSAVLYGIDDIRLEQRPIPRPKQGQLLIRVHTVGICGSDVHLLKDGRIGNFLLTSRIILGHETSGTVVEVGEGVKDYSIGDKVALEPGIPCRMCHEHCKPGRYNLCSEVKCFILPPTDGTLTRFLAYEADFCHKLPEGMTFEEGALIEPLAVGVHTVNRCDLRMGQQVLITGAGPIGTVCLLSAKAQGVGAVVAVDICDQRLEMIKQIGADFVINSRNKTPTQVREEVIALLGREPDATLECSGAEDCITTGILTTKRGGTVALVGLGAPLSSVPMAEAALRELDIKGIFRYASCFPLAIKLVAAGRINLKALTNAHFTLEQTVEAFKFWEKEEVMKVFIHC